MTEPKININLKATENEREQLRILAAKARLSVSEFIRTLVRDYGDELVRRKRQPQKSGFAPGDHYIVQSHSGDSHYQQLEIPFETPIVHVFMNPHGELTLVGSDDEDNELPLASINDLRREPEWVEEVIDMNWDVRVREGVVRRYCEHDGRIR